MVFLRFPFVKGVRCISFEDKLVPCDEIQQRIISCLSTWDFALYYNGKQLEKQQTVPQDATIHVTFSLPGGKGGFGSMLRAIGAQIEKTTNREACRDLSGRRLRDINEEQRLKKWIAKKGEREAEKARRRKERIERLKIKPKHNFMDFEYEKEISQLPERIDDAVSTGIQKAANKRPSEAAEASCSKETSTKKKRLWFDEDLSGSDSDSQEMPSSTSQNDCREDGPRMSKMQIKQDILPAQGLLSFSSSPHSTSENDSEEDRSRMPRIPAHGFLSASSSETSTSVNDSEEDSSSSSETSSSETELKLDNATEEQTPKTETNDGCAETSGDPILNQGTGTGCSSASNANNSSVLEETNASGAIKEAFVDSKDLEPTAVEAQNEDDSPVDLLSFESVSQLESLGLGRLKAALTARGLKCGGSISDRAQRLWNIRGLQPNEYPSNLLAKIKK